MKKRILSLVLAFAMAATLAPAAVGTKAEAARTDGVFATASSANDTGTGLIGNSAATYTLDYAPNSIDDNLFPDLKVGNKLIKNDLKVGDTVKVDWQDVDDLRKDSADNGGALVVVDYKKNGSVILPTTSASVTGTFSAITQNEAEVANANDVNVLWVSVNGTSFREIGTGDSYTITSDDVERDIYAILWMPFSDTASNSEFDETDDVIRAFRSGQFVSRPGWNSSVLVVGNHIRAIALTTAAVTVDKSDLPVEALEITSAYKTDGSDMVRVGNTFVVPNLADIVNTSIVSGGVIVAGDVRTAAITFSVTGDYKASDLWDGGKADVASQTGMIAAKDPLKWMIEPQTNEDKGKSTARTRNAADLYDGFDGSRAGASSRIYDIYVTTDYAGDKFDGTNKWYKTKYSLFVTGAPVGMKALVLDLNEGALPTTDRFGFANQTVTNDVTGQKDAFAYRSIGLAGSQNNRGDSDFYDLPALPNKGDNYFQGWSRTGRTGAILDQTSNLSTRYDVVYYAVFGDEEADTKVPVGGQAVYRVLNPATGEHLYTKDANEVRVLTTEQGWVQEANNFYGVATGGTAIRRILNPATGEHIYVAANGNEENVLTGKYGWLKENVVFRSADEGLAMYRMYNPNAAAVASHLYTTDANEYNVQQANGWQAEGAYFYGVQ